MSKVSITKSKLDALANAIAIKSGAGLPLTIDEMIAATGTLVLPTGTKSITANGVGIDVAAYASVDVDVSGGGSATIESLTVTPSESEQTFSSSSVDGYKPVTVGAVSSTYVGSGIRRRASNDLAIVGATVSAPAGYYESAASASIASGTEGTPTATKGTVSNNAITVTPSVTNSAGYISGGTHSGTAVSVSASELVSGTLAVNSSGTKDVTNYESISVPAGTVTAPASVSGTSATLSTGTNTLTLTKTVSVTPTVSTAGYVTSGTAGNSSVSLTASVTTKAAATIYPSTSDQSIAASQYLTGAQTIKAVTVSGLSADTILSGTTVNIGDSADADRIASVSGSVVIQHIYSGSSAPSSSTGSDGDIYIQTA